MASTVPEPAANCPTITIPTRYILFRRNGTMVQLVSVDDLPPTVQLMPPQDTASVTWVREMQGSPGDKLGDLANQTNHILLEQAKGQNTTSTSSRASSRNDNGDTRNGDLELAQPIQPPTPGEHIPKQAQTAINQATRDCSDSADVTVDSSGSTSTRSKLDSRIDSHPSTHHHHHIKSNVDSKSHGPGKEPQRSASESRSSRLPSAQKSNQPLEFEKGSTLWSRKLAGKVVCFDFLRNGSCERGRECVLGHQPQRVVKNGVPVFLSPRRTGIEDATRGGDCYNSDDTDLTELDSSSVTSAGFDGKSPLNTDSIKDDECKSSEVCSYFQRRVGCKRGDQCFYLHEKLASTFPKNPFPRVNGSSKKMDGKWRKEEREILSDNEESTKPTIECVTPGRVVSTSDPQKNIKTHCTFFLRFGECDYWPECKFSHEPPEESTLGGLSASGPSVCNWNRIQKSWGKDKSTTSEKKSPGSADTNTKKSSPTPPTQNNYIPKVIQMASAASRATSISEFLPTKEASIKIPVKHFLLRDGFAKTLSRTNAMVKEGELISLLD